MSLLILLTEEIWLSLSKTLDAYTLYVILSYCIFRYIYLLLSRIYGLNILLMSSISIACFSFCISFCFIYLDLMSYSCRAIMYFSSFLFIFLPLPFFMLSIISLFKESSLSISSLSLAYLSLIRIS